MSGSGSPKVEDLDVAGPAPDGRELSRRSALAWLAGAGALLVGVLFGRAMPRETAPTVPPPVVPPPSSAGVVPPTDGPLPFLLNLRQLKPYNLTAPYLVWLRTSPAGTDIAYTFFEGAPSGSIALRDAVILAVTIPAQDGHIQLVEIVASRGGPVPVLERLRDVGVPSDLAQLKGAQVPAPVAIGDMWLLLPRDEYWVRGAYVATVTTQRRKMRFSFELA